MSYVALQLEVAGPCVPASLPALGWQVETLLPPSEQKEKQQGLPALVPSTMG